MAMVIVIVMVIEIFRRECLCFGAFVMVGGEGLLHFSEDIESGASTYPRLWQKCWPFDLSGHSTLRPSGFWFRIYLGLYTEHPVIGVEGDVNNGKRLCCTKAIPNKPNPSLTRFSPYRCHDMIAEHFLLARFPLRTRDGL